MAIEYTSVSNPRWLNADKTLILCEVVFPHLGEDAHTFCASPDDDMAHGRQIFAEITAGKYGPIAAYAAPAPVAPMVPDTISDVRFYSALAKKALITEAEALLAVSGGVLPKAMLDAVASLGKDDQFDAKMYLSGSTVISRSNASVGKVLHLAFDMDEAAVITLFAAA